MRSTGDIQFFVCPSRIIPEPPFPSQGIAGSGNEIVRLRGLFMNFTSLIYVRILDDINNIKMVRGVAEIPDLFRVLNMIS